MDYYIKIQIIIKLYIVINNKCYYCIVYVIIIM